MMSPIFGALILERDPLYLSDAGQGLLTWFRIAGGFAALGIILFGIAHYATRGYRNVDTGQWSSWVRPTFIFCALAALLGYVVTGTLWLSELVDFLAKSSDQNRNDPQAIRDKIETTYLGLSIAGAFALLAVMVPFLDDVRRIRFRRIWGIAKLSYKEAVRKRIIFVFLFLILVGLTMSWFVQAKPEDQLRTYVQVVYWAMTPLLLLSAALLASLSIPTDIKQQTIHTITTKPVERFEIIAGRFLGYFLLMSLVLFIATTVSLFFVLRGLNPKAEAESLKARDPVFGRLGFVTVDASGVERASRGTNVGRVWDYRGYIAGPFQQGTTGNQRAVWSFTRLPTDLEDRSTVLCEMTFDIYRTNKGQENVPVSCTIYFETWRWRNNPNARAEYEKAKQEFATKLKNMEEAYAKKRKQMEEKARQAGRALTEGEIKELRQEELTEEKRRKLQKENQLALTEKFGYWEQSGISIVDYHTRSVPVPVEVFRNAVAETPKGDQDLLRVKVRCDSSAQLIGMAQYDLYLRNDDPDRGSDTLAFVWNFYKGAGGLWLRLGLLIALCVALSTQLGGIITFLCVFLIYLLGNFRDAIWGVIAGTNVGGGATESAFRLFTRTKLAMPLEEHSASTTVIQSADFVLRALLAPVLYLLPDIERFDYSEKVANGFNVGVVNQDLFPSFCLLVLYLIPWILLGYHILKRREIAGPY